MPSIATPRHRARVASVPAAHPYVTAIVDPALVELRPDAPVPGAPAGQWWPPRLLEPDWVGPRTGEFDVLHLHFGLESHPVGRVSRALDVVQGRGLPVVFTVHDLENPQLIDQHAHLRMLDEVVPRADVVLTLTDAAADRIAHRWGRGARVLPHPRLHLPAVAPEPHGGPRIGLHLRDLRPSIDGVGSVAALVGAVAALRADGLPVVAEVHLHDRVRDEGAAARIADLAAGRPDIELHRHARPGDAELAASLARLDALVLGYAWGTHSGWVELAWDAAVPVVGTAVGALAAQHPSDYEVFARGDAASLARAIAAAIARPHAHPGPARLAEQARRARLREAEQRAVRDAHSALYRDLALTRAAA